MSVLAGASEGLQPLFGQSYGAKDETDMKYYYRSGILICLIGSTLIVLLSIFFARPICVLFGASGEMLDFTVRYLPEYAWAFIVSGINTLISAYLYSTKRSRPAIILNVARSLILNTAIILGLSTLIGGSVIWFTFGISECFVLVLTILLKHGSEKNGIQFS